MIKVTAELAWKAIENYYAAERERHCREISFNKNAKKAFIETYVNNYKTIMNTYMDEKVEYLDRHKQAAILVHSTIACNVFTPGRVPDKDEIFIGSQQIALMLALSFMRGCLNEVLKENGETPITRYTFPVAYSCPTPYFDILTRDLYLQSHKDNSVYILFIAHILFFIEYLTMHDSGIDDAILREWNMAANN